MTTPDLEAARASFARRSWTAAAETLDAVDATSPLAIEDLERLAMARHMAGHADAAARAWQRAHRESVSAGAPADAARSALYLGMTAMLRGEVAQASGWFSRAGRHVEEAGGDVVEAGYLLLPQALMALDGGDPATALERFSEMAAIADRFGNLDLATLGRLGQGQALIGSGRIAEGVALLDDAMLSVTSDEVSPMSVGVVYCASIEAFQTTFDLRRAQEWTDALNRWCESQPDLVPFRGRCLVYRTELLRFHGRWHDAASEARRASDWLSRPPIEPALGEAHYETGELHRLRGEVDQAEAAYREASRWGRRPDPGLALLRLAQGAVEPAAASIRRALDEADGFGRPRLLEPFAEIMLAAGDIAAARAAADELAAVAARTGADLLDAVAGRSDGQVRLAEGDPRAALAALRRSWERWQGLDAPYDSARTRVGIAVACRALGDDDTADLELAAARATFESLEAAPDLARLDALLRRPPARPGGLSEREVEVLRLLAGGATNRLIASRLGISERTVDRHVSNIYTKLDVSTRAAATAFAYEQRIV
jgi:DNA-binding CsgD family transcriptional regulator